VNLKKFGSGMMMYKRRSVRRKNAINVYITTEVIKRSQKKRKESYERSKGSDICGTVSEIRYERRRKCYVQGG
jgi:hypothetical protein